MRLFAPFKKFQRWPAKLCPYDASKVVDYSSNIPFTTYLSFINSASRKRLQTRLQERLQPATKAEKLFENNLTVLREQKFSNCALFLSDKQMELDFPVSKVTSFCFRRYLKRSMWICIRSCTFIRVVGISARGNSNVMREQNRNFGFSFLKIWLLWHGLRLS